MNTAAVDCGTNSTRLLVADGDGRPLDRLMRITRLGQGVDATGALADEAVERTLDVLREYRDIMDRRGVERVRISATSAARDAANRERFLDSAAKIVGAPVELLSGEDEARVSFRGATSQLDSADGPFLVVDIGGGSTEFAVGPGPERPERPGAGNAEPEGVISVDVGCVRLTEKFLHHDPPRADELSQALSIVRAHLDDVARDVPATTEARRLVGLAGTITTLAAVEMGLAEYDSERIHHFVLTRDAAEEIFRVLATEKLADRIHNPGLERERADVIVGGAAILVTIMRFFDHDECLVSEADILDGLLLGLGAPQSGERRAP